MLVLVLAVGLVATTCITAALRPWIGIIGFYACLLLEPNWNLRGTNLADFPFQRIIALATVLGFLAHRCRGNKIRGASAWTLSALLAFLALALVSARQSIDAELTSFYLSNLWKIALMVILTVILIDQPHKLVALIATLAVAQVYSALLINLQYFRDGVSYYVDHPWGTMGDNNLYSNFTLPLMACGVSTWIFIHRWWLKITVGGVLVLQLHLIMLLQSRGAMLGAVVMFALIGILMPKNKLTIASTLLAILGGSVLAGPSVVQEFKSSFQSRENLDPSAASRLELWKAGWEITRDYPLLGVGPYAGQRLVPNYKSDTAAPGRRSPHNLILEISTGCGIPATLFYFAFFLIPWLASLTSYLRLSRARELADWQGASLLAVLSGVPAYIIASMFSSGALLESSYALVAVGCAAEMIGRQARLHEKA